jgi:cell division protein FtsL
MKAIFSSYITAFVLVVLIIVVGVGVSRQFSAVRAVNDKLSALQERLTKAEQNNDAVQADLNDLESDDRIEQEARQRLNLKKEGEHVVVIIPGDDEDNGPSAAGGSAADTDSQPQEAEPQGFFQNLFGWLGGIF